MPKVSQEYRDARRAQILDAARRCFLRDGFHETSMQDLFAEAGVSSGAFYGYFPSKDDVILAIAEENLRDVSELIRALPTSDRAPRSLGDAIAEVLDELRRSNKRNGIGSIAVLVWSEALRDPALARRFQAALKQLRAELVGAVRTHQRRDRAGGAPDAEAVAELVLSLVPGYLLQLALFGSRPVSTVPDTVRALWPD